MTPDVRGSFNLTAAELDAWLEQERVALCQGYLSMCLGHFEDIQAAVCSPGYALDRIADLNEEGAELVLHLARFALGYTIREATLPEFDAFGETT